MKHSTTDHVMHSGQLPLISVIVPVYNTAEYLARAIDSILASTYTNLEILLIDDGSSDGSAGICDVYASRDSRIRVFHMETNCGAGSARNKGMELASGSYLAFVDSDDTVEPEMYEELFHAMLRTGSNLAICRYRSIYADRIVGGSTGDIHIFEGMELFEDYVVSYNGINDNSLLIGGSTCNKLYSAVLVQNIRFLNGCWEDLLFNTQVLYRVKRAVYLDTAYYNYYCERPGSITNSGEGERFDTYRRMMAEKNKFFASIHRADLIDINKCFYYLHSWRVYVMVDRADLSEDKKQELKASIRNDFYIHRKQLRGICRRRKLPLEVQLKMRLLLFSSFLYLILLKIRNFLRDFQNRKRKYKERETV